MLLFVDNKKPLFGEKDVAKISISTFGNKRMLALLVLKWVSTQLGLEAAGSQLFGNGNIIAGTEHRL